ncbi:hypothetical protein [Novosphingobium terrae]|uniref:hypothetical protein n=1 Tax=Novosphingobium terrae TaxID=2726189 RepID=UPI0019812227|nr:hypothetical protein [Novosphingobium terrae]
MKQATRSGGDGDRPLLGNRLKEGVCSAPSFFVGANIRIIAEEGEAIQKIYDEKIAC